MQSIRRSYDTSDGITIDYEAWAGGDHGTILLLHGLGANGRQFSSDAAFFANEGYHVLVPDLRGHGRSTAPTPMSQEMLTVDKLASDLLPLLGQGVTCPLHIVGNSLGGLVGLELIGELPHKVSSLATFGTAYKLELWPGLPTLQYWLGRLIGRRRLAKLVAKNAAGKASAQALLEEIYSALDLRLTYLIQKNVHSYDYLECAASFAGHIMILQGDRDKGINRRLQPTLDRLEDTPRFQLCRLDQAGHFANLDQPERFRANLLAFFKKVELEKRVSTNA